MNNKNKTSNNSFEQINENNNNNNNYSNYNSTRNSYKKLLFNNNSQEFYQIQKNLNFYSLFNSENNTKKNIKIKEISFISKEGETVSYSNSKKINQDNIFTKNIKNNKFFYKFIGVCDGHGEFGHIISDFICSNLPKNLEKNLSTNFYKNSNLLLKNNIKNACIYTNSQIISNSNINSILSGSTCCAILFDLNDNFIRKIYSINVGDSRSVFFPFHSNPVFLSKDHTPARKSESERILSHGGRILQFKEFNNEFVGPLRIWLKNEDIPGLAMTRSFGDLIASSVGVICEPEIKEFDVDDEGVVVIGSDGLWEYFEVGEMEKFVKKMKINGKDSQFMAGELERIARQKWREKDEGVDDISVVVVYLE
jgi:serine/threonine protein phosphatase PrpC